MSEGLTPEQSEEEKKMLGYPSMRPIDFDGTLEAWLLRLSVWGTVAIKHTKLDDGIKDRIVSQDEFLNKTGNEEDKRLFGLWSIEQHDVNDLSFYRKFLSWDGKNYKEEFRVHIDLKPSLQKSLDEHRHKGFLGGMKKILGF